MANQEKIGSQATNRWLVCPKPNPQARMRLFCFPYAGGGARIYRNWPDGLPPSVEVCAVEIPGRGIRMRERALAELPPLVEAIAENLAGLVDKPFAFFGHSMGALIVFELARLLRKEKGLIPARLFVSGHRAPHLPVLESYYDLPEPEFIAKLREFNGTPKEILEHAEIMGLLIPILRADFALCQNYRYDAAPPLECPISAFGGLEDRDVKREALEAWREHTTSSFVLRMLPGDHFYLDSAQGTLLRILSQELHGLDRKIAQANQASSIDCQP